MRHWCGKPDVSLRFSVQGRSVLYPTRRGRAPDYAIDRLAKFFSLCLKIPGTVLDKRQNGADIRARLFLGEAFRD
jgi:hypothetical protein